MNRCFKMSRNPPWSPILNSLSPFELQLLPWEIWRSGAKKWRCWMIYFANSLEITPEVATCRSLQWQSAVPAGLNLDFCQFGEFWRERERVMRCHESLIPKQTSLTWASFDKHMPFVSFECLESITVVLLGWQRAHWSLAKSSLSLLPEIACWQETTGNSMPAMLEQTRGRTKGSEL